MRDAGFKSHDPLVLSLMRASISADGCDLLSAFKRHVKETGAVHPCPCMAGQCVEGALGGGWVRGASYLMCVGARLRMWLRDMHLGREWAGPFPFTPNPAHACADGG